MPRKYFDETANTRQTLMPPNAEKKHIEGEIADFFLN